MSEIKKAPPPIPAKPQRLTGRFQPLDDAAIDEGRLRSSSDAPLPPPPSISAAPLPAVPSGLDATDEARAAPPPRPHPPARPPGEPGRGSQAGTGSAVTPPPKALPPTPVRSESPAARGPHPPVAPSASSPSLPLASSASPAPTRPVPPVPAPRSQNSSSGLAPPPPPEKTPSVLPADDSTASLPLPPPPPAEEPPVQTSDGMKDTPPRRPHPPAAPLPTPPERRGGSIIGSPDAPRPAPAPPAKDSISEPAPPSTGSLLPRQPHPPSAPKPKIMIKATSTDQVAILEQEESPTKEQAPKSSGLDEPKEKEVSARKPKEDRVDAEKEKDKDKDKDKDEPEAGRRRSGSGRSDGRKERESTATASRERESTSPKTKASALRGSTSSAGKEGRDSSRERSDRKTVKDLSASPDPKRSPLDRAAKATTHRRSMSTAEPPREEKKDKREGQDKEARERSKTGTEQLNFFEERDRRRTLSPDSREKERERREREREQREKEREEGKRTEMPKSSSHDLAARRPHSDEMAKSPTHRTEANAAPAPEKSPAAKEAPGPQASAAAPPNKVLPKVPPPVPQRPSFMRAGGSAIGGHGAPSAMAPSTSDTPAAAPDAPEKKTRRLSLDGTRSEHALAMAAAGGGRFHAMPGAEVRAAPGGNDFAAQFVSVLKDLNPRDTAAITAPKGDELDEWPTKPKNARKWPAVEGPAALVVINPAEYSVELGDPALSGWAPLQLEDEERYTPYYERFMAKSPHSHYLARAEDTGPVIISIEQVKDRRRRVLVRTKKADERVLLASTAKNKLGAVLELFPALAPLKFRKVPGEKMVDTLIDFEKKTLESTRYKFGVLYCKAGQKEENEWYSNVQASQSAHFEEFLGLIGDRIKMNGWDKFCGGLDNKKDTTGKESVYIQTSGCEIMFHVSTLLPFYPDDEQQVERKRHLGNDVCMIIFQDPGCAPFNPLIIKSQFNHIFAIVQPAAGGKYKYRAKMVEFAYKIGVSVFGPPFSTALKPSGKQLRDFLLMKLINGQRASMYAPDFRGKTTRTRKTLLDEIVPEEEPASASPASVVSGGVDVVGKMFRRTLFRESPQ